MMSLPSIQGRRAARLAGRCAGALTAAIFASNAAGQYEQQYGLPIHQLTPVEERVGDVGGALSTSLRQINPGLGVPSGFEQVYRVPGHDDLMMRIDGGVIAVFPESVYVPGANGSVPLVPPNTTFYIGLPQAEALLGYTDAAAARPSTGDPRLDLQIAQTPRRYDVPDALPPGSKAGSQTVQVTSAGPRVTYQRPGDGSKPRRIEARVNGDEGPSIVADESYRSQRVRELIRRAAAARQPQPANPE